MGKRLVYLHCVSMALHLKHATPQPGQKRRAVVVGTGPAGVLAATYLAKRNFHVDVFDKTTKEVGASKEVIVGTRSYNIVLSRRALEALEGAEVTLPPPLVLTIKGFTSYLTGSKPRSFSGSPWSRSINRGVLVGALVESCAAAHGDRVSFHFGHELQHLDLARQLATFHTTSGEILEKHYDLLVAADGVHSRAREMMAAQIPGFTYSSEPDIMSFKAIEAPQLLEVDPQAGERMVSFSHRGDASNPQSSLICVPAATGPPCAIYIRPPEVFERLKTPGDYAAELRRAFPSFSEAQCDVMGAALSSKPVSVGGWNVRCSALHGPHAVLLGDAAHGMVPSLGQGANAALEDCAVLGAVLDSHDLSAVPEAYTSARHADALAAVHISEAGLGARDARTGVMRTSFLIQMMVNVMLHKALPFLFLQPAMMSMNSELTPYSQLLARMTLEALRARAVLATCAAVLVGALAVLVRSLLLPA